MNIDLAALRALEREREIPFDTILAAIETALLTAYRHTEGRQLARPGGDRPQDRRRPRVLAQEIDEDGVVVREYDDTPHDFGRIAAMTAKQVILQRLREATDEVHFGEYVGRDGDLVTGVIQAHEARTEKGIVSVDLGKLEAHAAGRRAGARRGVRARPADQVRGGARGEGVPRPAGHPVPVASGAGEEAVRAGGAGDRRRHRRDRRDRPRGRPPHEDRRAVDPVRRQRQGRLHRPDGASGSAPS